MSTQADTDAKNIIVAESLVKSMTTFEKTLSIMLLVDCRIKSTKSIAVIDDFDADSYTLIRLKQNNSDYVEKDCTSS